MESFASDISGAIARDILAYFAERKDEFLAKTRLLVELESPSGDEAGSRSVVDLLVELARGIDWIRSVERIQIPQYGEHLVLRAFPGEKSVQGALMLVGHTDTVHPRGSLEKSPWRHEGNRIHAPGIFDMKANCVLALEALRACSVLSLSPKREVVLVLTCDEETGSDTGRPLIEAHARHASYALVLEPPATGGRVKTGRKGTGIFTLEIDGCAAHAGLEPEKGVSAILEMARQIERLHAMNNSKGGININVGIVTGGTRSNVVPAYATAEIDLRFSSIDDGRRVENQILELMPFDPRTRVRVSGGINRPPLERTDNVLKLYNHAKRIASGLGFELDEAQVGGGSDGNFIAALGVPVLDGLGIDGDGAHAAHEHILVDDIERRGALLTGLITSL
jgi:glutamate carboxypeptidase